MPAGNLASLGAGPVLAAMVTQAIYTCAGGLAVDQGKVLTSAPWTTWMTGWLKPLVFFFGGHLGTWGSPKFIQSTQNMWEMGEENVILSVVLLFEAVFFFW